MERQVEPVGIVLNGVAGRPWSEWERMNGVSVMNGVERSDHVGESNERE